VRPADAPRERIVSGKCSTRSGQFAVPFGPPRGRPPASACCAGIQVDAEKARTSRERRNMTPQF
jgi:hypothetical protein